ncbi:DUF4148 domain-containing protein [Burkholderia plantarii]|uniref:DUF4148 domain-containing protein n=1 Tax=Burkholderia plantarii TaxID=41899 RepID=UPI0006D89FE2|nr:DUF4148 domain-containing protein [Burkholderia plantarii]ALK32760.1 hypothetical protein bpln_2g04970 [Burkholderia plantarii]
MKKLLVSLFTPLLAASAVAMLSGVAYADVTHLTSRGDVRAELVRVEQAGYQPARNSNNYPNDIQAAEAKLNARPGAARDTSGYGYVPAASTQGGSMVAHLADSRGGVYAHH